MPPSTSPLLQPLIDLAKQASEAILAIYRQSAAYEVHTKSDHSPLTQADLAANDIIRRGLLQLTPQLPVLSEEGTTTPWTQRQTWHQYWLVDPLDGTREFINRSGEFTINIALIADHCPVFGLLYVPVHGACYYAHRGSGAFKQDAQGNTQPIHVRPWNEQHTELLVSKGAREARIQEYFGSLGTYSLIRMSSAWKFALLAEGKADLSPRLGDTSEWDTAAGQCILEAAGGALVDLHGQPLQYNTKDSLVNPHFIALGDAAALREKLPWGCWNDHT